MANTTDILHAYRHLYRGLLQAVQYSAPARFTARDQLRAAFRNPQTKWDPEGVKRTVWFLQAAAKERGLEHRILKNLLRVKLEQVRSARNWKRTFHESKQRGEMKKEQSTAFLHYDMTVAMLNRTMGLCLR